MSTYIVINPKGLNVRSKPDTATGKIVRMMTAGEAFVATDVVLIKGVETWARLTSGDSVIQQYCMIGQVGRPAHSKEVDTAPVVSFPGNSWMSALDTWARSKGFDGPRP